MTQSWGEWGKVKILFSQYLFMVFKIVGGLKPPSPSPSVDALVKIPN